MKTTFIVPLFSRITLVEKLLFTKHLSIMLKSGITIVEGLEILSDQAKPGYFKKIVNALLNDIQNGNSLAKSLEKYPKVFNTFYVSLVSLGEESGTLDENLVYLADQISKEYAFRQKLKGALMYPTIVLIAAVVISMGIGLFVLPQMIDLFKGFGTQLPLATTILLFIAQIMQSYGVFIFIVFFLFIFFIRFAIKMPKIKGTWDFFLLQLPVIGLVIQNAELAQLSRNMGIMLKSGLTLTIALEIESGMTTNNVFKGYMQKLLSALTRGSSLASELTSQKYPKIPLIMTKMIAVGEKTGKLDETLLYLGDFFESEVDDATKNLSTVLEPIMLLGIGIVVAFIAFAVISPIYQLTASIQK